MKNHLNRSQTLLSISISIYLLMVSGTFGVSLWLMVNPREGSVQSDTRDRIEKEVDRSYGRFVTQFNFAIFLIGTSVWIFRQSVISQLKADVEKDLGATLRNELEETIRKDVKEEADKQVEAGIKSKLDDYLSENKIADSLEKALTLDDKFKAQLEKSRIFEELSIFIPPEEVFFQEQTDPKIQERLNKIVSELTAHIESHKKSLSLTVDDYTKLGDALYCLKEYEAAAEQYSKAVDDHSDAYRALFGIGNALRKKGQKLQDKGQDNEAHKLFDDAIKKYEATIGINPYYFVAYVNKGLTHRRLKPGSEGLEEGIKCFDKAIDISPNYYRAWYDKACYHALRNEPDKAMSSLKRAICIAPKQCKDLAAKDKDFCSIKDNEMFRKLIPNYNAECEQNSQK